MSSDSIKKNIRIGLGISIFFLAVSSISSYISIQNLLKNANMVKHSNDVLNNLNQMYASIRDAETGQRGYLLSGVESFLNPYNQAKENVKKSMSEVRNLVQDNESLLKLTYDLQKVIDERFHYLEIGIETKKKNLAVTPDHLFEGKKLMDNAQRIMDEMNDIESALLKSRTEAMDRFAKLTPYLIIFVALLSFLITIYFYNKVTTDASKRIELQNALKRKNEEIANRIEAVDKIAKRIAKGNYEIRLNEGDSDLLGSLEGTLNDMAESLQYSFGLIADKEWMQTGIAEINKAMVGEKSLNHLIVDALSSLTKHTGAEVAAMYLADEREDLVLEGFIAADLNILPQKIKIGEGIVGQSFVSNEIKIISELPVEELKINYGLGAIVPENVIIIPILRNGRTMGVMELGSIKPFDKIQIDFLSQTSELIGLGINVAQNRARLQELLEETRAQTIALQSQHTVLENMNAELEAQTHKIQSSEEELRAQQEELLQANRELEERSELLEERNLIISERNKEIQSKAEQLELSTKYKSEFLANMSHELRTPLNSILLLSRLMADNEELDKEYVEYASVIQSAGQGLLTLIDEILDLSKIEAGKMQIEIEPVALKEVVNSLEKVFRPLTNDKKIDFECKIDDLVNPIIETDRLRLDQILKNLLSNAIKFTSKGKITLNVENEESFVSFKVKDTGIGIAQNKQSLIFEAFQQEDGSTRRRFGGTGLGLSISRELAKLLGGHIKLESIEGIGSTFTLCLPKNHIKQEKEESAESISLDENPFIVSEVPKDLEDDRASIQEKDNVILIIEDDTVFAKVLLDFTRKRKYKGIVAVRGDQGIEMAKLYKPMAILLDLQLPVMDGWQVMEALKSNVKTRHIPVHMMSSLEVKKESLIKGAVDFINKPIALEQMEKIFQKLENVLSKQPKKVLIIEENRQHALALSHYLGDNNISTSVVSNVNQSIEALTQNEIDCVILDMGIPDQNAYTTLDTIKKIEGLENLPIIVFTGKNLSKAEEIKLKRYADSIVLKTAHSYQRLLDEAGLFLHLVEEQQENNNEKESKVKFGQMQEVLNGKTILIADDDVRNIYSLTKALEQHKVNVIPVNDGKQALNKLKENANVDLILMDMMMPEMDGYESIKVIRSMAEYIKLPIIAVTAKTMIGDREKCIAVGASDYISKPVDIDQLISLLRVWLYN